MARKPLALVGTIGDLIEVPPIRTVVQLVDTEESSLRKELLESFVFTAEIRQLFDRLLQALEKPYGSGAFLKGHYGSGKSHCLTYLRMLLEHDLEAWRRLPMQFPAVQQREWIVVSLPLLVHSAGTTLENAVMSAIEDELERVDGERPMLADRHRFLDNFARYIVPAYPDDLLGWNELEPEAAVRLGLEFLATLPVNPLQLHYDRRDSMSRLEQSLRGRGMVLLLDELSEFLRSKGRQFNEDIRYLQFLGEWSEKLPLFVVATLQQNLEELGVSDETSYLRIKERYPLRFSLSARHVADLIEGRLIHRKPGSEAVIARLWRDLDRIYPGLIAEADFLRIYPVHPATLDLLEKLMTLFSRHRGVVDFVHTRLAGDPLKGAEGILHEPQDRLLTPDTIFDHFRERFSELAQLAPYEQTVFNYLSEEIPRLFETPRDRELALQCLKLLILAAICPVPVETSAPKMAQMLARRISRIDPEINVSYLQVRILQVLVGRSAFVVLRGDQYGIDLAANVNQVLGSRIRELRQKLEPDWRQALALVNRPNLPLADLVGRGLAGFRVRWKNAERSALWGLWEGGLDYADLSKLLFRLDQEDPDVAVWLMVPGDDRAARLLRGAALLFWVPTAPDADANELLLDWQAHRLMLQQTRERDLRQILEGLVQERERRLERLVYELYLNGKLLSVDGELAAPAFETSLDGLRTALVAPRFAALFPQFAAIAPRIDALITRNLEKLFDEFILPGHGDQNPLVEAVLLPLQLLDREGEGYRLHPTGGPVAALLDLIPTGERQSLDQLQRLLQKSPWGLVRPQFQLIVAALVTSGRLQLYAHGRAASLTRWKELTQPKFDEVGLSQILKPQQLEQLDALRWMVPEGTSAARPREFWAAARERLQKLIGLAGDVGPRLSRTGETLPTAELTRHVERIQAVSAAVGQPVSSQTGLSRLLESRAGELQESQQVLERWQEFLRVGLREYQTARRRMAQLGAEELVTQLDALGEQSDPLETWRELQGHIEEFEAAYRERYLAAHHSYYGEPIFELRRQLTRTAEWKALERLGQVLGLEVPLVSLRSQLEQLPTACRRKVEDELLLGVRCACGFEPGQPLPEAELSLDTIRLALRNACAELTRHDAALENFLRGLHQLGQGERASRFDSALTLAATVAKGTGQWDRNAGQLAALLDGELTESLSRALTGHALVVSRSLEGLLEQLSDQRLPAARVRQIFEGWLAGPDLRPDSWVWLEGTTRSDVAALWLAAWLQQHQLAATPAMRRRYRLPEPVEDLPGDAPEEELWDLLQAASLELDPVLAASRERLFPMLSREFCRRALCDAPGQLARVLPDLPWEHLEVARITAEVVALMEATDYRELAVALREWSRARHLDLSAGLLTEPLENAISERLARAVWGSRLDVMPLESVPASIEPHLGQRRLVVLLLDGLRWDLWQMLRPLFLEYLGEPLLEEVALSPLPSVTARARQVLLGGDAPVPAGADGLLLDRPLTLLKAADEKRHRVAAEVLLRGTEPAVMLHCSFIDKRRHETSLELWPLYLELVAEARQRMLPILKRMPSNALVLLIADHGFLDPREDALARKPRAHGGGRWEERAVPAVAWLR